MTKAKKLSPFFVSSFKWLGNMKTDSGVSGLLRVRAQVVGSYWMGPRISDSPDTFEKTHPDPQKEKSPMKYQKVLYLVLI